MIFSQKFVCEDNEYSTYKKCIPAPLFRKSVSLESKPKSAEILICGLGFYDLFINGQRITKGYLAPYISNSDDIIYYDRYDLLPYLTIGENVIGIMLGDGFQNGKTHVWRLCDSITNSAPQLALSCDIACDGKELHFEADEFLCKKGPVLFNDLRSGVFYDARLFEEGWNKPGYCDDSWHKPLLGVRPRGAAKICEAEPIRVYREIKPVSIRKGELAECDAYDAKGDAFEPAPERSGGYIYDFGENNSGIYRLKLKGERGQKISIQCAEQLTEGRVNYKNLCICADGFVQRDIFYCSGGADVFEPMFTFHGYRYLYVSGITEEQATESLLTYLVMSSNLEVRGSFICSDEVVNKLYEMGRRSDISNFYYFPMDCPHREKNGWTGDASVSAEHMIMTLAAENSWREWLNNIRASQKQSGKLPGFVPTGGYAYDWGGPAWDSVIFNLPYFTYKYRGETEMIRENAAAMLRYLEYIAAKRDEDGIVAIGLGDWVPVGKNANQYDAELGFTDSVMVLDMCRKGSEMFSAVGMSLHAAFAKALGEEMLQSIRNKYIDFSTYTVKKRCQTSQAMAIFYDVFRENEKEEAFKALLDIIDEDKQSFTCGFQGMRVLFHVLADFGKAELAYHMITKPEFPSYRYWLDKGETTLLEHFFEYDEYYHSSKNHHFLGDIVNWFMRCIGGLQVQNATHVKVCPHFIGDIDWCKTNHSLPAGEIEIMWKRNGNGIELSVNTTGSVTYEVSLSKRDDIQNITMQLG